MSNLTLLQAKHPQDDVCVSWRVHYGKGLDNPEYVPAGIVVHLKQAIAIVKALAAWPAPDQNKTSNVNHKQPRLVVISFVAILNIADGHVTTTPYFSLWISYWLITLNRLVKAKKWLE